MNREFELNVKSNTIQDYFNSISATNFKTEESLCEIHYKIANVKNENIIELCTELKFTTKNKSVDDLRKELNDFKELILKDLAKHIEIRLYYNCNSVQDALMKIKSEKKEDIIIEEPTNNESPVIDYSKYSLIDLIQTSNTKEEFEKRFKTLPQNIQNSIHYRVSGISNIPELLKTNTKQALIDRKGIDAIKSIYNCEYEEFLKLLQQ